MRIPRFLNTGALIALLFSPCAAAAWEPVAVRVAEMDGVERQSWPLTFSLPVARGTALDPARLVVRGAAGKALPTQVRTLAQWSDGSPRWLQIDTQLALRRHERVTLQVAANASAAPATALQTLRATESATGIEIDTGAVQFTIPRRGEALLEQLRFSGQKETLVGPAAMTLQTTEAGAAPAARASLRLLECGPLRCRVEVRGSYGNGFDYETRIEAYAGQPFVRILHTFLKTGGGAFSELRRLALELPIVQPAAGDYSYGMHRAKPGGGALEATQGLSLLQSDNDHYRVDGGAAVSGALSGWLEWRGPRFALGVAARWFWQEYPQAFHLGASRLVYEMRADEEPAQRIGIGAAKTHEVVLWLGKRGQIGRRAAPALASPLVGVVDPAWLVRSRALPGTVAAPAGGFVAELEKAADRYLRRNAKEQWNDCGQPICSGAPERRRTGAYGMLNWGDWNFPGYGDDTKGTDAWGNLEYDTAQVLALTYAASGAPALLDATTAAARHFMDVDVIHALPQRPDWVGMNHPKNPMHFVFDLGGVDLGHTWNEGLISYFYLTGDERALRAARGIADYLVARIATDVRGNPRQWGWPQIALLAVYDATGEARYRDAALEYARRGSAAHPAKQLRSWKGGILADALAHTHAATGDAELERWLRDYAQLISGDLALQDARCYPALAYVAALRNDEKLRARALAVASRIKLGNWGKPFTLGGRIGLRIHSLLAPAAKGAAAPARPALGADLTSARLPSP